MHDLIQSRNFQTGDTLAGMTYGNATTNGVNCTISAGGYISSYGTNGFNSMLAYVAVRDGLTFVLSSGGSNLSAVGDKIIATLRDEGADGWRWYLQHGSQRGRNSSGIMSGRGPRQNYADGQFKRFQFVRDGEYIRLRDDTINAWVGSLTYMSINVFDFTNGGWDYSYGNYTGIYAPNGTTVLQYEHASLWLKKDMPASGSGSTLQMNNSFTSTSNPFNPSVNGQVNAGSPYEWQNTTFASVLSTGGQLRTFQQSSYAWDVNPPVLDPRYCGYGSMFRIYYASGPLMLRMFFGKNMYLKCFPTTGTGAGTSGLVWTNIDSKGGEQTVGTYTSQITARYIFFASYHQNYPTTRNGEYSSPAAKLWISTGSSPPVLTTTSNLSDVSYAAYTDTGLPTLYSNNGSNAYVDNLALYNVPTSDVSRSPYPSHDVQNLPARPYAAWSRYGRFPITNEYICPSEQSYRDVMMMDATNRIG